MSTFYLEMDSTYRDRNAYPYPADFVAEISQSANKGAALALDPVSDAAPSSVFTPFTNLTGNLVAYTSPLGSMGVTLEIPTGQAASKTENYYAGLVIEFISMGSSPVYERIYTWQYLQTFGGNDYFEITFLADLPSVSPTSLATFTIADPSSVSDPANLVFFIPLAPFVGNYYGGDFIFNQTRNQWVTIHQYDWLSHVLTASPQPDDNYTSGSWLLADTYVTRSLIPIQYGQSLAGITPSTATIVPSANISSYIGMYIRLLTTNEMKRIVAFNAGTNVATVSPGFATVPNGHYELLQFGYDNAGKIPYNFPTDASQSAVCYRVTLLNMSVPNTTLKYAYGGHSIFYPYLYVKLEPLNCAEKNTTNMIASNNPNSTRQLFRVTVNDSNTELTSPVVRLDGSGMTQTIKVQPRESFHFAVYKPDGSLLLTDMQDNYSPVTPNPFVQISACFHFERVN
jgi:hypothetical protein